MTEKTIDLDKHRGMAAQKATDLRLRQDELEAHLLAAPAANRREEAAPINLSVSARITE